MEPEIRIDKWLWAARIFKTRTIAAQACRAGHVKIGGETVKPSRTVRLDEVITARVGEVTRTVKVIGLIQQRVGPKLVSNYLEDQTPASEYLRGVSAKSDVPRRPKGSGRPTKKDRRALDRLL